MKGEFSSNNAKKVLKHPLFVICMAIFLLANSSSHPTNNGGYTGAPGDGVCAQCHGGSNPSFNGNITIDGVPTTITAGQIYQITVTVSNPNGNANRAGFQMVALTSTNTNAGDMTNPSAASVVKTSATKKYFGHSPAVPFTGSNDITWTVDWTAPSSGTGDITFYGGAILGNGSNSSGDKFITTSTSGTLSGGTMALSATLSNVTNVSCFNGSDGSATADAIGGSGVYTYAWTSGESTQTAENLPAGIAKVTVTDSGGSTAVAQATINQPLDIVVNINNQTNPTCFNSGNGSITVSASGGNGGFSYDWPNGTSGPTINGLNPGTYIVTVIDVKNCEKTRTITLTAPPTIEINTANIINQKCTGQANGSISLTASGGTGTLTYDWSNGGSGPTILNLLPNNYIVSITDASNCELIESYIVGSAAVLNLPTPTSTNVSCNGGNNGSAVANPTGGAGNFTYSWTNGATTKTVSNLAAGTYGVIVTDNNQCSKSSQVVISQPLAISTTSTTVNASCIGVPNGSATIEIQGGTPPYTTIWSNGTAGPNLSNVVAGEYTANITDSKACLFSTTVTIGANQSATLALLNNVSPKCFGGNNGSISISSTNAQGYNIAWSNGGTGTSIANIPAGIYTALASGPNGCQSNQLSVTVTEPTKISPTSEVTTNVACFGQNNGSIATAFNGGTGALTYAWNTNATSPSISNLGPGDYSLSVTDINNCQVSKLYGISEPALLKIDSSKVENVLCFGDTTGQVIIFTSGGTGTLNTLWSNGSTGNTLSNIGVGTFNSTTKDLNDCLVSDTFSITSPSAIADNATIVNETVAGANNGSITTSAIGGVGSFTYLWSNGATTDSLINLAAGIYQLTITDSNSCAKEYEYNVQIGGCALSAIYTTTNVSCFGGSNGSITINASNGTPPYTTNVPTTNLGAGNYSFTVLDAAGCAFAISNVVITQPTVIVIKKDTIIAATSATNSNGSIGITVNGGTGPYSYEWLNAAGNVVSTLQDPINLLPGDYTVNVKDINNCILVSSIFTVGFTSATNQILLDKIKVYPNPATNFLSISSPFIGSNIEILDAQGKKVTSFNQSQALEKIEISSMQNGLYLIKIYVNGQYLIKSFLKQ